MNRAAPTRVPAAAAAVPKPPTKTAPVVESTRSSGVGQSLKNTFKNLAVKGAKSLIEKGAEVLGEKVVNAVSGKQGESSTPQQDVYNQLAKEPSIQRAVKRAVVSPLKNRIIPAAADAVQRKILQKIDPVVAAVTGSSRRKRTFEEANDGDLDLPPSKHVHFETGDPTLGYRGRDIQLGGTRQKRRGQKRKTLKKKKKKRQQKKRPKRLQRGGYLF